MHGYTYIEVLTASLLIIVVGLVIALFMNPSYQVARERDAIREDAVREYMEAFLDVQLEDPERFEEILEEVQTDRTMIGVATDCSGSFGAACADSVLKDVCMDASGDVVPVYLDEMIIDPVDGFSERRTGFYAAYIGGIFEVGACYPETRDAIQLQKRFDWE